MRATIAPSQTKGRLKIEPRFSDGALSSAYGSATFSSAKPCEESLKDEGPKEFLTVEASEIGAR
jgi:hypothetical protein